MTTATLLSELENLRTDITVAAPSEYVDSAFAPVPEGTYNFRISSVEPMTDKEGNPTGKAFVVGLKVDDPTSEYNGRSVSKIRVWTTTYLRAGARVSMLGDLIRGLDSSATFASLADAFNLLLKAQQQGQTFRAKLVWEGFDIDHWKELGGPDTTKSTAEYKTTRAAASIKGMRNFTQLPDGSYAPEVTGPSGNPIEASFSLDRIIPSHKRVR